MRSFRGAIGLVVLVLAACATGPSRNAGDAEASDTLRVTYTSVPEGASVIDKGMVIGHTPYAITYRISSQAIQAGECFQPRTLTIEWVSGAKASASAPVCGNRALVRTSRPEGAPGLDKDLKWANAYRFVGNGRLPSPEMVAWLAEGRRPATVWGLSEYVSVDGVLSAAASGDMVMQQMNMDAMGYK